LSEILTCSCCGRGLRDNAEENSDFGQVPYPHDTGFGTCIDCGGDKKSKDFKQRLGWAGRTFFEARFDAARNALKDDQKTRWDSLSYERKVAFIAKMIEKGNMI
jgi:hypothetical protein